MATKRKNAASSERAAKRPREEADGTHTKMRPTLLSIPAELRNRIYEEVLVSREDIYISDAATKPPSLLSTCRQIRREARQMWYLQNKFKVVVRGCNSDLCVKFEAAYKSLQDENGQCLRKSVDIHWTMRKGVRDWSNLLEWCKRIQSGRCDAAPPAAEQHNNYICVVATAHDVACQYRGQENWEECRRVLESLRQAFGRIDKMWLEV